MPVRSEVKSNSLEAGMREFRDEHGGNAVDRRAALLVDGLHGRQRIEEVGGDDHGGAMREAGHVAQHHAEAMVEGHRNADPVALGQLHGVADKAAIVGHVVVAQLGALGLAGGAAGVLDVDGVVRLEARLTGAQLGGSDALALSQHGIPTQHPGRGILSEVNRMAEIGQLRGLQLAGRAVIQLGGKLAQGLNVVTVAEGVLHHQSLAAGLLQHKFQFMSAEAEVEVDQYGPHLGRAKLHQHPLRDVGGPDSDPVAALKSQGHQSAGGALHFGLQLPPVEAQILPTEDESG